jgi:hypothetical protein
VLLSSASKNWSADSRSLSRFLLMPRDHPPVPIPILALPGALSGSKHDLRGGVLLICFQKWLEKASWQADIDHSNFTGVVNNAWTIEAELGRHKSCGRRGTDCNP